MNCSINTVHPIWWYYGNVFWELNSMIWNGNKLKQCWTEQRAAHAGMYWVSWTPFQLPHGCVHSEIDTCMGIVETTLTQSPESHKHARTGVLSWEWLSGFSPGCHSVWAACALLVPPWGDLGPAVAFWSELMGLRKTNETFIIIYNADQRTINIFIQEVL